MLGGLANHSHHLGHLLEETRVLGSPGSEFSTGFTKNLVPGDFNSLRVKVLNLVDDFGHFVDIFERDLKCPTEISKKTTSLETRECSNTANPITTETPREVLLDLTTV